MRKRRIPAFWSALVATGLAFAGCAIWISLYPPWFHFSADRTEQGVALRTLQLGEYYTPVTELVIEDDRHLPVVRLEAKSDQSMMHTIGLKIGRNEFRDLYLDGYRVEGSDYEFRSGIDYTARVRWSHKRAEVSFRIPKQTAAPGPTENPDDAEPLREDY